MSILQAATLQQRAPKPTERSKVIVPEGFYKKSCEARLKQGEITYGQRLMTFNGRDALVDCAQELLDALVYCQQAQQEQGSVMLSTVYQNIESALKALDMAMQDR